MIQSWGPEQARYSVFGVRIKLNLLPCPSDNASSQHLTLMMHCKYTSSQDCQSGDGTSLGKPIQKQVQFNYRTEGVLMFLGEKTFVPEVDMLCIVVQPLQCGGLTNTLKHLKRVHTDFVMRVLLKQRWKVKIATPFHANKHTDRKKTKKTHNHNNPTKITNLQMLAIICSSKKLYKNIVRSDLPYHIKKNIAFGGFLFLFIYLFQCKHSF